MNSEDNLVHSLRVRHDERKHIYSTDFRVTDLLFISVDQLRELRKASLARLFCDNGDEVQTMQPSAFLKISGEYVLFMSICVYFSTK